MAAPMFPQPAGGEAYERDCFLYLRKSKGIAGLARQRRDGAALAARLRWRVVDEFVDVDTAFSRVGAGIAHRDDYQRMMQAIKADARPVPVGVIGWHADRLHRNLAEVEAFIPVCDAGRHPVETVRSGRYELWTPTGRKRLRSDTVDAAYEVDQMIDRLESDRDEKARQGRWLGGPVPFGWKLQRLTIDDDDKILVLDAEAAEAIRWACREVLRGISLYAIARQWDVWGLRRRKGGLFDGAEVRRMLLRPRNAGLMEHRKKVIETELPGGVAEWPAIVSEEMWRAVRETLTAPGRGPGNSRARKWLGSNLFLCGVCGGTVRTGMGSGGRADGRHSLVNYRCRVGGGGHVSRTAARVDEFVRAVVTARLTRPDFLDSMSKQAPPDLDEIRARLAVQQSELSSWRRLAREGKVSAVAFAESEHAVLARIAEIKGELVDAVRAPIFADILGVEDVTTFCEAQPLDWWRSMVAALATVTIRPAPRGRPPGWRPGQPYFSHDSIVFDWHIGGGPPA